MNRFEYEYTERCAVCGASRRYATNQRQQMAPTLVEPCQTCKRETIHTLKLDRKVARP